MRTAPFGAVLALVLALRPVVAGAQAIDVPVRLMLFGDATFSETERDDIQDGFALGQLVGHMNASLSPKLLVFVEGTLTPTAGATVATLERLIVRYDFDDWLKISGGRYHNPISYWNAAFHHGSWLQTSVGRPRVVGFGSPYIPIHFNGLLAEGSFHTGPLVVAYEAGLGNGRQMQITLPGDAGDDNGSLALLGGLRLRSIAIPGAEIGAHVYDDRIGEAFSIDERIYSAHVAYQRDVELIAEFMRIAHDQSDLPFVPGEFDTDAWYVHLGYRLPRSLLGLRPYVRFESISEPDVEDVLFTPTLAYDATVVGVRWDFSAYAALKAEYRDEDFIDAGPDDGRSLLLNASFVIPNLLGGGQSVAGH